MLKTDSLYNVAIEMPVSRINHTDLYCVRFVRSVKCTTSMHIGEYICWRTESAVESSCRTIQHLWSSQRTVFTRQVPTTTHRTTCLRRHTDQGTR